MSGAHLGPHTVQKAGFPADRSSSMGCLSGAKDLHLGSCWISARNKSCTQPLCHPERSALGAPRFCGVSGAKDLLLRAAGYPPGIKAVPTLCVILSEARLGAPRFCGVSGAKDLFFCEAY